MLFDSLRRRGGTSTAAYLLRATANVMQTDHFEISVEAYARTINVHRLRS